jgi:hypothetical protein
LNNQLRKQQPGATYAWAQRKSPTQVARSTF